MKSLFLAISLVAFQAGAVDEKEIVRLPAIQNVQIVLTSVPSLAAVQPQGLVQFEFASCAPQSFSVDVQEVDGTYLVKAFIEDGVDCAGPTTIREYDVQYSSDAKFGDRVVVLNPQTNAGYKPL